MPALEGAIAIAQKHAGVGGTTICGDKVESAIPIHIPKRHGAWIQTRGKGGLSLEGAIAIAQKHAGAARISICGDDVESAIPIHIPNRHGAWIRTRGKGGLRRK